MGVEIIIECFVVVVVGGMGSLPGAVVAGLLIGEVVSLTSYFAPKLAEIIVFVVMALVLLLRPSGLLGEPGLAE
jgi:branched-chain amino acid transport system permease protein